MRTNIYIGNWKMNFTIGESIRLVTELKSLLSGKQDVEVVVAPSMTSLHPVCIALQDEKIKVAAQNLHWDEKGPFTGEVSALMLTDVGCEYVIVGHSERRRLFHEDNRDIQKKFKTAIEHDLIPILCVGETLEEREANKTGDVIREQIRSVLTSGNVMSGSDFIVAYEPVWAIGTGKNATPQQVQEMISMIRTEIGAIVTGEIAERTRIIYGGSVTSENVRDIEAGPDIDGFLVGGASLNSQEFVNIAMQAEEFVDDEEEEDA